MLLLLAFANGFTGYALPDDLLSGMGLRIAYSIVLAIPFIGTWFAFLFFGGEFPAAALEPRLFVLHVLLVPALIIGLVDRPPGDPPGVRSTASSEGRGTPTPTWSASA